MPSIMKLLSVTAICLNALTSASPAPRNRDWNDDREGGKRDGGNYALPQTNSGTELPAPPAGLTLKFITLGRGVQNYTCASASATPVAIGAIAKLYDGKPLVQYSQSVFNAITSASSHLSLPPGADTLIPTLGNHYFDAAGVPTFDLGRGGLLKAAKSAAVDAPASADKGPDGTGAVPWLYLTAKPGAGSVNLAAVYRVVTSGGAAPSSCAGQPGVVSIDYATQYWFYGSA
ncbi:MAG: hypothetical protein M1814_005313 [Vezdaea aestivalis]|nr:MAG: hypothetical protein M1814_005313 [Vezdaea aestivalis]